ncbi:cobaltochelatase subunit CobN, partial [Streptomyces sp. SID6648]|nr:cobaltochelatase subunit CobN [Streptomyces sp. SID6648]
QIRDGLHVLGGGPVGEPRVNLVLAVLRASQVWGGRANALPGLRASLAEHFGLVEKDLLAAPGAPVKVPVELTDLVDGPARSAADAVDLLEQLCRRVAEGMELRAWDTAAVPGLVRDVLGTELPDAVAVLEFACTEVVPRLARTTDEIGHILRALDGGYVPAGPSGSPTRGLVNVLPTGRNFYSVDPK